MQDAVDGGPGGAVIAGDLAQAHPAAAVAQDGFPVQIERPASDVRAFQAGAPHAGADPLDDQRAFQFRDGADDHHDGPAQRTGRIDLLAEADELNPQPVELVKRFEEVACRPGDAIAGPHQHHIEAAAAGIGHHLIEAWPARFGAGDLVRILPHDLEAALDSHLAEVVQLGFRMLVDGRDSHVECGALHGWKRA